MKNGLLILIAVLIFPIGSTLAQGFEPPSEGKAVVYFVRVSKLGGLINFRFFHNDKYIGRFNAQKYMRYECDPGEHLFWAKSENRSFMTATLEAGKIYVVEVMPMMGGLKAGVKLSPVDFSNPPKEKWMEKMHKLINKKPPQSFSDEELDDMNANLKTAIQDGLDRYENSKDKEGKYSHLAPKMVYDK